DVELAFFAHAVLREMPGANSAPIGFENNRVRAVLPPSRFCRLKHDRQAAVHTPMLFKAIKFTKAEPAIRY
ncbi:MAG: hypothetical protein KDJ69_05225, partial [Nitratireductor sp.]|nr:hypothetical protein [Nitratireductor sp.]